MAIPFLDHLDLGKNEIQNAVVQRLASAPGTPANGQIYYDTTLNQVGYYNGSSWIYISNGSGNVTQGSNSGAAGRVKVSGGADKTIADYTGSAGLLKTTDASGTLATAVADTDYATPAGVLSKLLTGYAVGTNAALASTDSVLTAFGKLQAQINGYAASTKTLTNTTFDANGTGNSITNIETADFAAGVIDTDVTLAANSDTKIASQKAVKAYVDGMKQAVVWKDSVRVATVSAGTLASSFANGQVVDGVTLVTGDRILIKDQAAGAENGIYTVNATGAPTRAVDADTATEIKQAAVFIQEGTTLADTAWVLSNNGTITLGTTALTFVQFSNVTVPNATTAVAGKVVLATQAEAEAKADTSKVVTPSDLVNFPIKKAFTVGDGSATSYALTHNLGTQDVTVSVRRTSDNAEVMCTIVHTSTSVVTISFSTAPATNTIKAVVIG